MKIALIFIGLAALAVAVSAKADVFSPERLADEFAAVAIASSTAAAEYDSLGFAIGQSGSQTALAVSGAKAVFESTTLKVGATAYGENLEQVAVGVGLNYWF